MAPLSRRVPSMTFSLATERPRTILSLASQASGSRRQRTFRGGALGSLYGNLLTAGGDMFVVAVKANNKNVMRVGVAEIRSNENKLMKLPVPLATTPRLLFGMKLAL